MGKNNLRTSDLFLTAYLTLKGHIIKDVQTDTGGQATFVVEETPTTRTDMLDFFNRQSTVEPMAYIDQMKVLKSMIRNL